MDQKLDDQPGNSIKERTNIDKWLSQALAGTALLAMVGILSPVLQDTAIGWYELGERDISEIILKIPFTGLLIAINCLPFLRLYYYFGHRKNANRLAVGAVVLGVFAVVGLFTLAFFVATGDGLVAGFVYMLYMPLATWLIAAAIRLALKFGSEPLVTPRIITSYEKFFTS